MESNNYKPILVGGIGEIKSNNQWHQQDRIYDSKSISLCLTTSFNPYYCREREREMEIRKITPRESFRLMGFDDKAYDRVKDLLTDNQIYHLAGDSIVTTCLMGIFGEMLGIDYQTKIKEYVEKEIINERDSN